MNRFKGIMLENHTKGKANLHSLYTDKQVYISSLSSSQQPVEGNDFMSTAAWLFGLQIRITGPQRNWSYLYIYQNWCLQAACRLRKI